MTVKGETIATGAPTTCEDCKQYVLPLRVLYSGGGYYVGTMCGCGPYSRESGYYATREQAEKALEYRNYSRP